jgi:hypothetical protein
MPADESNSEWLTRKRRVDPQLHSAGWPKGHEYHPGAHRIEEFETDAGPADYALCIDDRALGIVDAKKLSLGPQNVLTQAERYSNGASTNPFSSARVEPAVFAEALKVGTAVSIAAEHAPAKPKTVDLNNRDQVMVAIREVFSAGGSRTRQRAINELSVTLSYSRAGSRIAESLDGHLRAAGASWKATATSYVSFRARSPTTPANFSSSSSSPAWARPGGIAMS